MTYSIIGRDPETGAIGIGVQSRWFHAGQDVAWIEPGVGAVCTQAIVEPRYGPDGLRLLRGGRSPAQALDELTAADGGRDLRQVAIADAEGRFAQHTGARCVAAAGHATGDDCCAQGNMLARDTCWDAMVGAFEAGDGDLIDRLLSALDAAERAGGDARGRQSAAIVVWTEEVRTVDLRVADHPEPVQELRRLVDVKRAYDRLGNATDLAQQGELVAAAAEVDAAHALAPADDQITFWRATMLAGAGRIEEAATAWEEATRAHPGWPAFLDRCIEAGMLPPETRALAG
jgi:uncharacterized Ntn-hydrolase superfamily protein